MALNSYILIILAFLSVFSSGSQGIADLNCTGFYVKVFNSATKSTDYLCQDTLPWSSDSLLCSNQREVPYVITYSLVQGRHSVTYYRLCCLSRECLFENLIGLRGRYGHRNRTLFKEKKEDYFDVFYADEVIRRGVLLAFFSSLAFFSWYVFYTRFHLKSMWTDEGERVHPGILKMAERLPMTWIKMSDIEFPDGVPITGQHSLLDFSRMVAARAFRSQNARQSKLIDMETLRNRILRHDIRMIRIEREKQFEEYKLGVRQGEVERYLKRKNIDPTTLTKQQMMAYKEQLRPKCGYKRIDRKWVKLTRQMKRNGWKHKNYRYMMQRAVQRYVENDKTLVDLQTTGHYDTEFMQNMDYLDMAELVNQMWIGTKMYMIIYEAAVLGHEAVNTKRFIGANEMNNQFEAVFYHGPYLYPWKPDELITLFADAKEAFLQDDICLNLDLPIVLLGDIRGRYVDLHRWIQIIGLPYKRKILFLGGIIERGEGEFSQYSLECLAFIAAMKCKYPRHVFMLRGSAETVFSLPTRYDCHTDTAILLSARLMCSCMPLCAIIGEQYLATSSGLSPQMAYDPFHLNKHDRPLYPDNFPMFAKQILFGQPSLIEHMFQFTPENGKCEYGLKAVDEILEINNLRAVIRSRNDLSINPLFVHKQKLITISSAPTERSSGIAMMIDEGLGYVFFKLKMQTTPVEEVEWPFVCVTREDEEKKKNERESEEEQEEERSRV